MNISACFCNSEGHPEMPLFEVSSFQEGISLPSVWGWALRVRHGLIRATRQQHTNML